MVLRLISLSRTPPQVTNSSLLRLFPSTWNLDSVSW